MTAGPLISARFPTLEQSQQDCDGPCPMERSCLLRRATGLVLRPSNTGPADCLQVVRDLLREGLVVLTCRETHIDEAPAFFAVVCGRAPEVSARMD